MPTGRRAKDITGERFGRLVVQFRDADTPRGTPVQMCICDCGNTRKVTTGNLRGGQTRSCGCLRVEHAKRIQPGGAKMKCKPGSLMRQLMGHYKQSAERRGVSFSLTEKEFEVLVQTSCFYCGEPPSREYRPTRYTSSYRSSGVDRVDNHIGYETGNVVSCCKVCNRFKSDMSVGQMFSVVEKIYKKHFKEML